MTSDCGGSYCIEVVVVSWGLGVAVVVQRLWGVFVVAGGAVVAGVFVVGVAVVVGDAGVVSSFLRVSQSL